MLLTKQVDLKLNSRNCEHYRKLGYNIPTKPYKYYKRDVYDYSKKIKINVTDLQPNSNEIIEYVCENCNKIEKIQYKNYYKKKYKEYCNDCINELFFKKENHPRWKSEKTDEERLIGRSVSENKVFIKSVLKRDNYTCRCCGTTNCNLNAHHLDGWDWCVEKRYDIDNGITLCKRCHDIFHNKYGRGGNTKQQFEEWFGKVIENPHFELVENTRKAVYCYEENKVYYGGLEEYCDKDDEKKYLSAYNCCVHNVYTYKGMHLFWYDEYKNMTQTEIDFYISRGGNKFNENRRKKIICLTTGKLYESISAAHKELNITKKVLLEYCNKNRQTPTKKNNLNIPLNFISKEVYDKFLSDEKLNIISMYKESLYDDSFLFNEYLELTKNNNILTNDSVA